MANKVTEKDLADGIIKNQHIHPSAAIDLSKIGVLIDTHVWHVSKDGNDTTGDGSVFKPLLTIAQAITNGVSSGDVLSVGPGTFIETFALDQNTQLMGSGFDVTIIQGDITLAGGGSGISLVRDIQVTGDLLCAAEVEISGVHGAGSILLSASSRLSNNIMSSTGAIAVQITGGAEHDISNCVFAASGAFSVISHGSGELRVLASVLSNSSVNATIDSSSGLLRVYSSEVLNANPAGAAIDADNGATDPANVFAAVTAKGDVVCGTSAALIDGVSGGDDVTGSALVYRPSDRIFYDNTVVSVLAADTVQEAIDELATTPTDAHILGSHVDTSFGGITVGQVPTWNGSKWTPQPSGVSLDEETGSVAFVGTEDPVEVAVTFGSSFLSINSIQLTPDGNVGHWYKDDVPSTGFSVAVSASGWIGNISWTVKGTK